MFYRSGRWDLNPRHQPWQGCALPLSYIRRKIKGLTSLLDRPMTKLCIHFAFRGEYSYKTSLAELRLHEEEAAVERIIYELTIFVKDFLKNIKNIYEIEFFLIISNSVRTSFLCLGVSIARCNIISQKTSISFSVITC